VPTPTIGVLLLSQLAGGPGASADVPAVANPFIGPDGIGPGGTVNEVDLRSGAPRARPLLDGPYEATIPFAELDTFRGAAPSAVAPPGVRASLPEDLVQVGDVILPEPVTRGAAMVHPDRLVAPGALAGPEACTFPDAVPAGIYEGDPRAGGEIPRRGTIFLNFTGGVLNGGEENSAENRSTIALSGHMFPVYTGGETKAIATAQAVMADFQFWQLRVVYEQRPRKLLPYVMVMVGGSYQDTTAGPSGGVAPLDCEDFGQRNVCFAFMNEQQAVAQANVISQEVGHTYGLGHTEGGDRIMGGGYSGASGDLIFGDDCMDTIAVQGQASACVGVNKCHCGDPNLQHDRRTIGWIFAPPGPDEVPPEITLTAPADGSAFTTDDVIHVTMDVGDNFGGYGWKLVVIDDMTGETLVDQADYARLQAYDLKGLPEGRYRLIGEIEDQASLVTTDQVIVTVGPAAGGSGSGSASGGGATDGGATSGGASGGGGTATDGGTGASGASGGSEGTDANPDATGTDEGCGCRTADTGGAALACWLLPLVAAGRRRRRG
jgi:hypothetical protein